MITLGKKRRVSVKEKVFTVTENQWCGVRNRAADLESALDDYIEIAQEVGMDSTLIKEEIELRVFKSKKNKGL